MVIDVPVTAISNATGFDGYQVIVMPTENSAIEEEPTKFSTSGPGNVEISVVNSYAKKAAAMRQNRLQLQCSHCDYKCLTPILMSFHSKSAHKTAFCINSATHKSHNCTDCSAKFLTKAALETHLVMIHDHSKDELAKKRLYNLIDIPSGGVAGKMLPTENQDFVCETCLIKCESANELSKHMEQFHQGNLYLCQECLFKAPSRALLLKHMQTVHNENGKKFRCLLCNTTYNTRGGLTRHTLKEHKGHKMFVCDACGKKFQTHKTLDVHKKVVHERIKPFKCELCDYEAGQKASLIAHVNSVHENNRPYVCELCGYKTAAPSTLNAHKRMVHEKQRPFVCETCGRSFAAKAGMENHILLIHNKAMPYACEHCNKRFKRKPDLVNHVRCQHHGQYFVCTVCNNSFHSQRNLDRHISVVHDQIKPFECGICGMTFSRKEKLKQHVERFHGEELGDPLNDVVVETPTNLQTIQVQTIPVEIQHG